MKKTRTSRKKTISTKTKTHAAGHSTSQALHHSARSSSKMDLQQPMKEAKKWGTSFSHRLLSDYAIPFTRLVEAKLVSLQHKI